jgi:hypothetical protein
LRLDPGTIAYWRDFRPGISKFVYILGQANDGAVLSFTISSQTRYLSMSPHRDEMVEIPFRSTDFLDRPSYIQCFHDVERTPLQEFREMERVGAIMYRGHRPEFLAQIAAIAARSQLLTGYDRDLIASLF